MGDKFAGGVAERLDEELNSLIQDYETIKEFADFLANSTAEERQALLNKYGDAAKKLFTDSEYRGQVGEAIVEAFKEGITDDIEKFTRIKSGDEKDIGYTTTHAALMAYGVWKRYGKKIGKDVVRAVDDDVAKNTVDSKTLKKAKDVKKSVSNPIDSNGKLKPNVRYKSGEFGYIGETDSQGRLNSMSTESLKLTEREKRLSHNPKTPGKEAGDHAGHLMGDRFGGSPEIDNLVSQASKVNQSAFRKIENQWARAIQDNQNVQTKVTVNYLGNSTRPSSFIVKYKIGNGKWITKVLENSN